jgi:hypothetical protein
MRLRESRDDPVKVAAELDNDSDPRLGPSVPEQSLSPRYGVGLSVARLFDGQQDYSQEAHDLWVQGTNVGPRPPVEFNVPPVWASDKKYHTR